MSKLSFDELLRQARLGEPGAADVLLTRYQGQLRGYAMRIAASKPGGARPSDFIQDVALRAFARLKAFRGTTEAEWIAWLRQILQNQVLMAARRAGRAKRESGATCRLDDAEALNIQDSGPTPSSATSQLEDWHRLLSCLHELPEAQKEALVLCYLKELPVAEVAQEMGKSEAAVASLLQRGLRTLRDRMTGPTSSDTGSVHATAVMRQALLALLRRRDLGERVDIETFLAEYPQCSSELRTILNWVERIQAIRPCSI